MYNMSGDATDWYAGGRPRMPELAGARLDGVVTTLSVLMLAGIVADFQEHAAGISFAEEGFFTPEHVFFYSMFLGVAGVLFVATYRERLAGATWIEAVPPGYEWAVIGVAMFGGGGIADFGWHSAFGFEEGIEALVSPSHLLLAAGATLFFAAPLRAAWLREGRPTGVAVFPVVASAAITTTLISMFAGFINPLLVPYPAAASEPMRMGMSALVAFPLLFVGIGLALVRRFRPPVPALTIVFTSAGLASASIRGYPELVVPALLAGVVADLLVRVRPPTAGATLGIRAFCTLIPVVLAASYFVVVDLAYGITHAPVEEGFQMWSMHAVAGTVVLAGAAGLLLSYLITPGLAGRPETPTADEDAATRSD
jgi:hypothetical protein